MIKKNIAIILIASMLTGCAATHHAIKPNTDLGTAPPPKMPDLPAYIDKKAEQLPPLTDKTLAGSQIDGSNTDRMYNDLATRFNSVIDAWHCVSSALNNHTDVSACFGGASKAPAAPTPVATGDQPK